MINQRVVIKILLSLTGVILVIASFNLFASTTDTYVPENKDSAVLSFSSTTLTHIKGTPFINPELEVIVNEPSSVNGLTITYEVIGTKKGLAIPPNIIKTNDDVISNESCKTTFNEENQNYLLSCYFDPIIINNKTHIASIDLSIIEKLATREIVKIKIKESNSYITINSADLAIVLNSNEFNINFISLPLECLNIPLSDINCDGSINSFDMSFFETNTNELENYIKYRMDLNSDGIVNDLDNALFQKALKILSNT